MAFLKKTIAVIDPALKASFEVVLQYPSALQHAVGHEGLFRLVLLSHGNGGSHLLYPTIADYLAENGWVVALVEHYGNNRKNNLLSNSDKNITLRTKHLSMSIDAVLQDETVGTFINSNSIAAIGHSMGGTSLLGLAGGRARSMLGKAIPTTADARVKALVLMAPGSGWFGAPNALEQVHQPILLLSAEHDLITPFWNAEIVLKGVADSAKIETKVIKNAGHFSFLSPFDPTLKVPGFLPATDPIGFDREAFHQVLPALILDFLNRKV